MPILQAKFRSLRKTFIFASVIILSLGTGTVALWGGHLPQLLREGYPAEIWPAPGSFAKISGNHQSHPDKSRKRNDPLSDELRNLFQQSGGRALLVLHKGRIVLEHYADGFGPETSFNSYSVIKSLIGALALKAVSDGKIKDLNNPIGDYLPTLGDQELRQIPIQDFLTMQSGIAYEPEPLKRFVGLQQKDIDKYKINPFGPMAKLHFRGLTTIEAGLRSEPKERGVFNYQNVNTAIVGKLLEKVNDTPLADLLSQQIWKPAGAQDAYWRKYNEDGPVSAYCCVYATLHDWGKIGSFLLTNGKPGKPFLPKPLWQRFLVHDQAAQHVNTYRYGLHIRHDILDRPGEKIHTRFAFMTGRGGQIVYILPEKESVVVRFGEKNQLIHSTLYAVWRMIEGQERTTTSAPADR